LSELSNEQKRHFVLAVTGSGAASRNVSLALNRHTSGCKSPSPDFVPAGAFLRDTPKIRFISTKSTEPIRRAATMVPESGCAVAKDRAGVASQRGDAPAPTTRTMLSKARTGRRQSRRSPRLGQRLCCLNFWQSEIRFSVSFIARGATTRSSPQLANEATTTPRHAVRCFDPSLSIRRRCARTRILCRTAFSNWALAAAARAAGGRHLAVTLSGNAVEKLF
jgi:hypothetical protein